MAPLFTELADQWRLSVSDPVVTRVLIDWAPTLQVAIPDGLLEIKVEAPFVVSAESATLELEPAGDPQLLGPALAVVRKRLHSVSAFKNGRLDLVFEGGVVWRVDPSPLFEA